MTLQALFTFFNDYKAIIVLLMLLAPWLALGICIAVPGEEEEPFVLGFNIGMASLSLLLVVGYLWYATNNGGWNRVVREADILLMLAPCYYVGVSFWVARQRLPLQQIPVVRAIQGLALIGAAYLGLAWFLNKIRILLVSFVPFKYLFFILLGLIGLGYWGYLRLTGADRSNQPESRATGSRGASHRASQRETSIEDELKALRREIEESDR